VLLPSGYDKAADLFLLFSDSPVLRASDKSGNMWRFV